MLIYLIDLWKHCDSIKFSYHSYRDQNKTRWVFSQYNVFFSLFIFIILIILDIIMCRTWFLISQLMTLKVQWQP